MPAYFENHEYYLWSRPGWLLNEEVELLYYLATRAIGTIVEIGSFKGKSTCCFIIGSMDGNRHEVISIDKMERYDEYNHDYGEVLDTFNKVVGECDTHRLNTLIKENSDTAHVKIQDNSVDLLFIDGGHSAGQVKRDFDNYYPKVNAGGLILFHDSTNPNEFVGVYEFAESLKKDGVVEFIGQVRAISIFKKR
jgi:predicted O-methyltransferase YrrM